MSTRPRTKQLLAILGAATKVPPSAREAFVREAAGDDDELYGELMVLLGDASSDFFGEAARLLAEDREQPAVPPAPRAPRQIIPPGTQLGTYTIIAPLGFGGMGEVYRARDRQLQREVAIKVLPASMASRGDLVERLKREAKLLASLNHRNVAAIYGLHEADGVVALILELVEGPTLAHRIADGPLPLAEAVPIARQVAEALEAAHDKGIVHRDLKPDNVKIRPDGEVKVLDFGIAKALKPSDAPDDEPEASSLTIPGAIFGTPSYMSPEQLRGLDVDRRADLWGFGLLLWEMLTARPAFGGANVEAKMMAVLTAEPDWAQVPAGTPPAVWRLLRRTLQKDRKVRLDSAAVARLELDEALSEAPEAPAAPRWKTALPWAVAAAFAVALATVAGAAFLRRPPAPADTRISAELGADIALREDLGPASVVSPDGRTVVFTTRATDAPAMLYVRKLGELVATPLSSTENASSPFFSPDGKWIAFFSDRKLKRISASGGAATVIADVSNGRGGWWGSDDTIVFADSAPGSTIARMPASGGKAEPVTTLLEGEVSHRWPQMLPGSRALLYTANTSDNWDDARVMVQPLPGGKPAVVQSGYFGRYVASGHLLYVRGGTLYAAPFDIDRLQVTGPSAVVIEDVGADPATGGAQISVSDAGSLVYLQGHGASPGAPAVWMDRGGNTTPLRTKRLLWGNPRFSPDGQQLAFDVSDGKQVDVWLQDLGTGQVRRLTFDPGDDFGPVWSPDGRWIAFASTHDGVANIFRMRSDGAGEPERLTRSPNAQTPTSWHPSGKLLALQETRPDTATDIMTLAIPPPGAQAATIGEPVALVSSPAVDAEAVFSPDGRWVAYRSRETGQIEVFVQAFDGARGKWQVSSGGGRDAAWSRGGSELLYFGTTQDRIMVAPYTVSGSSFRAGTPRPWSIIRVARPPRSGRTFDLHPDSDRVAVAPAENQKSDHITLVTDLFSELHRVAPVSR